MKLPQQAAFVAGVAGDGLRSTYETHRDTERHTQRERLPTVTAAVAGVLFSRRVSRE